MSASVVTILTALLGAGVLQFLITIGKGLVSWRRRNRPEHVEQQRIHEGIAAASESVAVVVTSRVELANDNKRLRTEMTELVARHAAEREEWRAELQEQDIRHATERAEWLGDRKRLRQDMEAIEARLRASLDELDLLRRRVDSAAD